MLDVCSALPAILIALAGPEVTPVPGSDELPIEIVWKVPNSCPSLASERAEIRRRIGTVEKSQLAAPLSAEVEIRSSADGSFRLSLRTHTGNTTGERDLAGQTCQQLAEAAALVLALLINPNAAVMAEPPAVALPASPAPSPVVLDRASTARFAFGIDGVLAGGALPGIAAGVSARLFFQRGPALLVLRAGALLPKETSTPVWPEARASFYALESALALCGRTSPARRVGAMVCLGGAIVRLHGESKGVSTPGDATAFWPEALAEAAGQLRLTQRTRLRIGAEVRGLGSRPDFAVLGLGSVFRPSATSLRAGLGLDMLF